MNRLAVCRVCMANDVRMFSINNTLFQDVFEKLTGKKLTKDGRPETLCYLCSSQLQKCCRFLELYQKTETKIAKLSNYGLDIPCGDFSIVRRDIVNLSVTPAVVFSTNNISVGNSIAAIKEETVEVKIEAIEFEERFEEELKETPHCKLREDFDADCMNISERDKKANHYVESSDSDHTFNKKLKKKEKKIYRAKIAGGQLLKCSQCNATFTYKCNLKRHMIIHAVKKQYACDKCEKSFYRSDNLKNHQNIHTRSNLHPCGICNMLFTSPSNVREHVRSIHYQGKSFSCEICNKCFNRKGTLLEHLRVHSREKPYACDKCNYRCAHQPNLKVHFTKMHNI